MSDEPLPPAESCLHNLHRTSDGRRAVPEATDLCSNDLGVFHMVDCPLTLGLSCAWYDAAPEPHPTTTDLELEATRERLQRDFLGWRYRRRVRLLSKPRHLVSAGIVIDAPPEPEEIVPEALAMRAPPPEAAVAPVVGAVDGAAATETTPAAPAAPERYPGQRRSEERLAKKKARMAERAAAAAAAKAAQIAAAAPSADEPRDEDDVDDDDEFGAEIDVAAPPEDTGPKTVEQVLAALPDAPVGESTPRRGPGAPRGGREGVDAGGGPRRRRRRGRRGRGAAPGPRPGGPSPQRPPG
jgi:hypothetical protein